MDFNDFDLSKNEGGLLPAIIQDARTRKVLMLGYMNREAFEKSAAEGLVTFYSRTRGCLWTKGETSGNFLHIKKMYKDCDSDTLLIEAIPDGPTCHRGTLSCFDTPDSEGFLGELAEVIRGRHEQMPEGSYTTKLFIKGVKTIAKKVRPFHLRDRRPALPPAGSHGADGRKPRRRGRRTGPPAPVNPC